MTIMTKEKMKDKIQNQNVKQTFDFMFNEIYKKNNHLNIAIGETIEKQECIVVSSEMKKVAICYDGMFMLLFGKTANKYEILKKYNFTLKEYDDFSYIFQEQDCEKVAEIFHNILNI